MIAGTYLKYSGIAVGVITVLIIVTKHPIITTALVVGAALYFVGKYLEKI